MIRKAVKEDASIIFEYLKQILILHKKMYPTRFAGESKYTLEEVESLIARPDILILVSDNIGVDGYIIVEDRQDMLFIDDLYVDEKKRGLRIGHELVDAVMAYAQLNNYFEIQLNVWLKNENAVYFYEKLGFEPLKTVFVKEL